MGSNASSQVNVSVKLFGYVVETLLLNILTS